MEAYTGLYYKQNGQLSYSHQSENFLADRYFQGMDLNWGRGARTCISWLHLRLNIPPLLFSRAIIKRNQKTWYKFSNNFIILKDTFCNTKQRIDTTVQLYWEHEMNSYYMYLSSMYLRVPED